MLGYRLQGECRPAGFAMKRDSVSFMPVIFRKTAKGHAEIETRAHRLVPRLRAALIMVDGKRTDVELATMLGPTAEALSVLAQEGFIELLAELAAPVAAPAPAARPVVPAKPAPPASDFEPRRRVLLRAFNDLVGPAGESLAMRIEKTKTVDELRALMPQAVRLVELVGGRSRAEEFAARVDEI
jgi:hypothetical protein